MAAVIWVHNSQLSQETAVLFDLTPLSHTVHGYLGVLFKVVGGPGLIYPACINRSES